MRPLILVGAGGFSRETAEVVRRVRNRRWDPIWIVDDDPSLRGTTVAGLPVRGGVAEVGDHPEADVVVPVGNPGNFVARAQVVERLRLAPDRHPVVVDPSAVLGSSVSLGGGTIIHPACVLTADIVVGGHVAMMPSVVLTHDDEVGDYATFASGVRVGGGTTIGEGAYLGAGAVVLEGLQIGAWSLVGAGSVVRENVPSGEVWAGNPARRVRDVRQVGDLRHRLARLSGPPKGQESH